MPQNPTHIQKHLGIADHQEPDSSKCKQIERWLQLLLHSYNLYTCIYIYVTAYSSYSVSHNGVRGLVETMCDSTLHNLYIYTTLPCTMWLQFDS